MNFLSLILWVTQFGLSLLVPPCFFLLLANWLQAEHGWGFWTTVIGGILGILISISTARANWRAMKKEADSLSRKEPPPVSFNDHN